MDNLTVLNSLPEETKFIFSPQITWFKLLKEPHEYMLGKRLLVLYEDGEMDIRAVGKLHYDDGHFEWAWVEDTCYDKDSDFIDWESVKFWAFMPSLILKPI